MNNETPTNEPWWYTHIKERYGITFDYTPEDQEKLERIFNTIPGSVDDFARLIWEDIDEAIYKHFKEGLPSL